MCKQHDMSDWDRDAAIMFNRPIDPEYLIDMSDWDRDAAIMFNRQLSLDISIEDIEPGTVNPFLLQEMRGNK